MFQKLLDNPEAIIALCALLTSTVSIFFTYKSLKTQKEHNLKSVRPIGVIILGDYENDIYVRIDNNGIGPLIIKDIKVSNSTLEAKNIIDLVPDTIKNKVIWTTFVAITTDRAIKVGDELYLLRKTFEESDVGASGENEIKNELRNFLENLTVELSYTDIYEKSLYEVKRKLTWFGRH